MKILHIANLDFLYTNGIDVVVDELSKRQLKNNSNQVHISSLTKKPPNEIENAFYFTLISGVIHILNTRPDVVIFHSLYNPKVWALAVVCIMLNIKYWIVPHSSLTRTSQIKSKIKKKVAFYLFVEFICKRAKFVQYLSDVERKSSIYDGHNTIIIGNGVNTSGRDSFLHHPKTIKYIAYLGRYDIPHKGLDMLFDAICKIQCKIRKNNVKFIFHGFDQQNGLNKLQNLAEKYQIDDLISLNGPLLIVKEKEEFLAKATFFIHTSRYEGVPISILEALSFGVPCIVTEGTNLAGVISNNKLGWSCKTNTADIADIISEAINADSFLINEFSENAIKYCKLNLSWDSISMLTLEKYQE